MNTTLEFRKWDYLQKIVTILLLVRCLVLNKHNIINNFALSLKILSTATSSLYFYNLKQIIAQLSLFLSVVRFVAVP